MCFLHDFLLQLQFICLSFQLRYLQQQLPVLFFAISHVSSLLRNLSCFSLSIADPCSGTDIDLSQHFPTKNGQKQIAKPNGTTNSLNAAKNPLLTGFYDELTKLGGKDHGKRLSGLNTDPVTLVHPSSAALLLPPSATLSFHRSHITTPLSPESHRSNVFAARRQASINPKSLPVAVVGFLGLGIALDLGFFSVRDNDNYIVKFN